MTEQRSTDLYTLIPSADAWSLDISSVRRGIDNYHVDVRISPRFSTALKTYAALLLTDSTGGSNGTGKKRDHSREAEALQNHYVDLMGGLLHRLKTDLSFDEVQLLQFAVFRQVIETVRNQLDEKIADLKSRASEYRAKGDVEALTSNVTLTELQRNYEMTLFDVNRQIFLRFQRAEARHLLTLRQQLIPDEQHDAIEVIQSALLWTSNPASPAFLMEQYRLWSMDGSEDVGFNRLNAEVESLLAKMLPEFPVCTLRPEMNGVEPELHDTLGGLLQSQRFMGIAASQKSHLQEQFCWLDYPEELRTLFNEEYYVTELVRIRREEGLGAWWRERRKARRLMRVLDALGARLQKGGLLRSLVASQQVSKIWNAALAERTDRRFLCQYFSGQISAKGLQERSAGRKPLTEPMLEQLEKSAKEVEKQCRGATRSAAASIIEDVSRFRLHLKYYRFAHRAFNRIAILKSNEDLNLSRQSGSLYSLMTSEERTDIDRRIVHHAVMKADVRGSTLVTEELMGRDLNPASYFSLRFFSPINRLLGAFRAEKVFIEGDAVILSFLEHENEPEHWFAVARACGLAKDMLSIVHASNRHSRQMNLPPLELGIGICYSANPPRFLYDEEKPIMISSAIGQADRMSSCSWRLRQTLDPSPFSVDVFSFVDSAIDKGEKGQQVARFNVNGILVDEAAVEKLHSEISLKRHTIEIAGEPIMLLSGRYPDARGKRQDLVLREGRVGLWEGDGPVHNARTDTPYFEVVTDRKLLSVILNQ